MENALPTSPPSEIERVSLSAAALVSVVRSQAATIEGLKQQLSALSHQLEWFKRQMFGTKSERLSVLENSKQLSLAELESSPQKTVLAKERTVAAHTRRVSQHDAVGEAESVPFFDEARVPIETIPVHNREAEGLSPEQFEVIGEKASYRLAQRSGSYVVLKYVRPVIKRKDTQGINCPPAPQGVIEGSRADVSFVAGLVVDKFAYHLLC